MVSIFDHLRPRLWITAAALLGGCALAVGDASGAAPAAPAASHAARRPNDYPTYARVQYVEECMARNGGSEANVYKCSCAIDRIAARLDYDQFVEASTYAHYATLGGENAGIFRDHPLARRSAKLYRAIEDAAYRACGLASPAH